MNKELFNDYASRTDFKEIGKYINGWDSDTMQPIEKDWNKYKQLQL